MTNIISRINLVESQFDNIYIITTDNGLIIDLFEFEKPIIGSTIEYNTDNVTLDNCTSMNGSVFYVEKKGINVTFGGLLGYIPVNKIILNNSNIKFVYKLYLISNA